jgi:hypothetical protein
MRQNIITGMLSISKEVADIVGAQSSAVQNGCVYIYKCPVQRQA